MTLRNIKFPPNKIQIGHENLKIAEIKLRRFFICAQLLVKAVVRKKKKKQLVQTSFKLYALKDFGVFIPHRIPKNRLMQNKYRCKKFVFQCTKVFITAVVWTRQRCS